MKLLVIIPDYLSDIISKGEMQPDYYNPGRVFGEVHILLTNNDQPDLTKLQYLVGDAKLYLHNHSDNLNLVGMQPEFLNGYRLRKWAKAGVDIARKIMPDLIRCHGADWNLYLASRIKATLGIPYVTSLHINPDINPVRRIQKDNLTVEETRHNRFYDYLEYQGLSHADLIMPVYKPILPYLQRLGLEQVEVFYNVLNNLHLKKKHDYSLHHPLRIIYVGRLIAEKNPDNILKAVARMDDVLLTVVGDGPILDDLRKLSSDLEINNKVNFIPAVMNDELCTLLAEQDIFAVHTEYWEISKSVLEALLTGLPVVINNRIGKPVPELMGDFVHKVDNTADEYYDAFNKLTSDDGYRATLGEKAMTHARANWDPSITETRYKDLYRKMLGLNFD